MISKTIQIGHAAEHLMVADLLLQGYTAFLAGPQLPYDVVVDLNNIGYGYHRSYKNSSILGYRQSMNIEETINAKLAKLYTELAAWELIYKGHIDLEKITREDEHYCVHSYEAHHRIEELKHRINALVDANRIINREEIDAN